MTTGDVVAGLPLGGPATLPALKAALRIAATDERDDAELTPIVGAVNSLVRSWPVAADAAELADWPEHIERGAVMLAARLFRRRNSPAGVEAFGSAGAVYVMRNDPDVAMLLRLGSWARPGLG